MYSEHLTFTYRHSQTHTDFFIFQLSLSKPVINIHSSHVKTCQLMIFSLYQLCYARGTILPCFISLSGSESRVLDLLSAPKSIVLSLKRRVRFYNQTSSSRQDVAWNETVEDMGSAVWWPSSDSRSDSTTRYLEGEIRLVKDLRPTSEMAHFSIAVSPKIKYKRGNTDSVF